MAALTVFKLKWDHFFAKPLSSNNKLYTDFLEYFHGFQSFVLAFVSLQLLTKVIQPHTLVACFK